MGWDDFNPFKVIKETVEGTLGTVGDIASVERRQREDLKTQRRRLTAVMVHRLLMKGRSRGTVGWKQGVIARWWPKGILT